MTAENKPVLSKENAKEKLLEWSDEYKRTNGRKPLAYIHSYGCQQNVSDGEKIKGMLSLVGYEFTNEIHDAQFILFNTCAVRENAEDRVFGNLGDLKHYKEQNPEVVIGVCGCMAQQKHIAEKIKSTYRQVDLVFGTFAYNDMYEMLLNNLVFTGADISRCGMVREDDGGYKEIWGDENSEVFTMNQIQGIQSVGAAEGILPVSPCNKLFKMSQVLDIRFDTSLVYAEDTLFNYEAMKKAQKIVCQDKPKYHYIRNGESASHKNFNTARFDEHKVTDIIMSREMSNPETYPYCVKGDVLKTFRTIKQMMVADTETDKFDEMRMRIVNHRREIFSSGLYSKASILKTVFLWLCPSLYKIFIELYGKHSNRRYNKKVNV